MQLPIQKSYIRITPGANGGPVIPDRECMESVIKAANGVCGSPGGIFFSSKVPKINAFSLKQLNKHKKKANS